MSEHAAIVWLALNASRYISECGNHPEHLRDAERLAREAGPALDALVAELSDLRSALDQAYITIGKLVNGDSEAHAMLKQMQDALQTVTPVEA